MPKIQHSLIMTSQEVPKIGHLCCSFSFYYNNINVLIRAGITDLRTPALVGFVLWSADGGVKQKRKRNILAKRSKLLHYAIIYYSFSYSPFPTFLFSISFYYFIFFKIPTPYFCPFFSIFNFPYKFPYNHIFNIIARKNSQEIIIPRLFLPKLGIFQYITFGKVYL